MAIFDAADETMEGLPGVARDQLYLGALAKLLDGQDDNLLLAVGQQGRADQRLQLAEQLAQANQRVMQRQQQSMPPLYGQRPPAQVEEPAQEEDYSTPTPDPAIFARRAEMSQVPGVLVEGGVPRPRPPPPPRGTGLDDLSAPGLEGEMIYDDNETGNLGVVKDGQFVLKKAAMRGKISAALRNMGESPTDSPEEGVPQGRYTVQALDRSGAFGAGFGQGLTMEFADDWAKDKQAYRAFVKKAAEAYPSDYYAGKVAGALGTSLMPAGWLLKGGLGVLKLAGAGALVGGSTGAVESLGEWESDPNRSKSENAWDAAGRMGSGGMTGAAWGAGTPFIYGGGNAVARRRAQGVRLVEPRRQERLAQGRGSAARAWHRSGRPGQTADRGRSAAGAQTKRHQARPAGRCAGWHATRRKDRYQGGERRECGPR